MKTNKEMLVDFFIVGQPKSGTTALANFLSQHPDIAISKPKEPVYFATDFHKESDVYHGKQLYFHYRTPKDLAAIFSHANPGSILGEASTSYLYSKVAAKNIHSHNPAAKIIIMLRNPIDMVHSLHMQYVNETQEDELDFEKALRLEGRRKKGQQISKRISAPSYSFYSDRVKYSQQIKRFQKLFPPEQIMIVIMEKFKTDNSRYTQKILKFLGIHADFDADLKEVHGSKAPRSRTLNKVLNNQSMKNFLHKLLGPDAYTDIRDTLVEVVMKRQDRDPLPKDVRNRLKEAYKTEVIKAEKQLGLPLRRIWHF